MEQAARTALALLLIFNSPAFATVTPIKQGQPAPYNGFVFDYDSESEAEQARTDASYFKRLSDKQAEKIALQDNESQILEKRLQLYINESNVLAKDRATTELTERLYILGAFALGVIATGLIVRNIRP